MAVQRNTMGKVEFILDSLFWMILSYVWYKSILFKSLTGLELRQSKLVLWGMLLVLCGGGTLLCLRRGRNRVRILINAALPFCLYAALAYAAALRGLVLATTITAAVLCVLCAAGMLARRIPPQADRRQLMRLRLRAVAANTSLLAVLCLLPVVLVPGINVIFDTSLLQPSLPAAVMEEDTREEHTIANNMDTLLLLQQEAWVALDAVQRLDVLQTVANIEARYLGLPHELNVGASNTGEYTLGHYADATHHITVSLEHLMESHPLEVLDTVCHEAYHAYQHRVVDVFLQTDADGQRLRMFGNAREYALEFRQYADGEKDFEAYYLQACESDARSYGRDAVADYCRRIEAWLEEQAAAQEDAADG